MSDIGLYVHLPFCRRKCRYCSFVSYAGREVDIPCYVNSLKNELTRRGGQQHVTSIYLGGGTPSLVSPPQIGDIFHTIHSLFTVAGNAEVTMEANPGTIDQPYLSAIRALGINRLSLGVQSLNDAELKLLGRIHTAQEAKEAAHSARNAGFANLNLDLIYGLPGQTVRSWRDTLTAAASLRPEHLSLYALTLDEDVPLQRAIEQGDLPALDPDLGADQYELAEDLLAHAGYAHYEISNWARPGYECRHNLIYWHNLPYLGVGVAAHSCLEGRRLGNTANLDEYLTGETVPALDEAIGPELKLSETVILALRLSQGVSLEDIQQRFGIDIKTKYQGQIKEMTQAGLMERNDGHLRLTPRGRLLGNEAFWRFLPQ